ncbi:hypothetical protein [Fredinandcohnia onubensis]|uniref:hypothetical protein n=1 Tax=Fredinandcohnia onubensis TaxID=1571209 RepID=UPI000C0C0614|nr:hypothetical protein [Fredinandcohnia onubensis]
MKRNVVNVVKKDAEIQTLINEGRKAYYRKYRQKPEYKAKARKYRDNFFLKQGLEQINAKGGNASENLMGEESR